MASIISLNISTPRVLARAGDSQSSFARAHRPTSSFVAVGAGRAGQRVGRMQVEVRAAPEKLSEKVEESIKQAEEACAGDPVSGECVAAWDEVEELSAAASHARDRKKDISSDPLEKYCNDNPETDECRTYDT